MDSITIHSRSNFPPEGSPLTLSRLAVEWTAPLVEDMARLPYVELDSRTPAELGEGLKTGEVACGLIPPLQSVLMPFGRVISGIGVCSQSGAAFPKVYGREDEIAVLAYPEGWEICALTACCVFAAAGALAPRCLAFESGVVPEDADAVLCMDAGQAPPPAGFAREWSLSALWREHTGFPLVHALWTGSFGAPYPRLRSLLAGAVRDGAPVSESQEEADDYYYAMASLEMDGIRALLEQAAALGFCPDDAYVRLC
jgi:hypothetical protein